MSADTRPSRLRRAIQAERWSQLWAGVVCMVLIANLQYAWTLFVDPMHRARSWTLAEIQFAFSIFIATETWITPLVGWIVDRLGPRRGPPMMIAAGGLLVAAAWVLNAYAAERSKRSMSGPRSPASARARSTRPASGTRLSGFLTSAGWRSGCTAAGFGAGAALTVVPISLLIQHAGYQAAFFWFGLGQGAVLLLVAPIVRAPLARRSDRRCRLARVQQTAVSSSPGQVLRSPLFWLLYVMLTVVSASGLMATAQIAPIARDFGLDRTALFLGASALNVALVVDSVMNGLARPFFGWVSDQIGREYTMAIAFTLGGIGYWLLASFGTSPWSFVIFAALIFFTWGKSSACSRPPARTYSARAMQPRTPACSTPPRDVGLPRAARERAEGCDRRLVRRVGGLRGCQFGGGRAGAVRAATAARHASCADRGASARGMTTTAIASGRRPATASRPPLR